MSQDPERLARFEREAKALASLNHPNIAQIYAVADGALVMEFVRGKTLAGALPLETALRYGRQIALALEAAHEKGIIHPDLKPGNIMVTPDGNSFGIVRRLDLVMVVQSFVPVTARGGGFLPPLLHHHSCRTRNGVGANHVWFPLIRLGDDPLQDADVRVSFKARLARQNFSSTIPRHLRS